jgi:hypothetical protein
MLIDYYLDTISKELSQSQSNLAVERGLCSSQHFFTNIHRRLGTIDEIEGTVLDRQFQTANEFLNKAWKDRRVTFLGDFYLEKPFSWKLFFGDPP